MLPDTAIAALQEKRKKKLKQFGYKKSYGPTTSQEKGTKKRAKALQKADDWFFAELGRQSSQGQHLLAAREFFYTCRNDFGWKESYGTLATNGDRKRERANEKALKYVSEKYGYSPTAIQSWCY